MGSRKVGTLPLGLCITWIFGANALLMSGREGIHPHVLGASTRLGTIGKWRVHSIQGTCTSICFCLFRNCLDLLMSLTFTPTQNYNKTAT